MPPVRDIQHLRDRITVGCETIRCTPGKKKTVVLKKNVNCN